MTDARDRLHELAYRICYGMVYGMRLMTERTTFALDRPTVGRLKRLAGAWHVSQAEVVRRAIALADASEEPKVDRSAALRSLHASSKTLVREAAETYLSEVEAARRDWRKSA